MLELPLERLNSGCINFHVVSPTAAHLVVLTNHCWGEFEPFPLVAKLRAEQAIKRVNNWTVTLIVWYMGTSRVKV